MRDWPKDGKRHSGGSLTQAPIRSEDIIERVELLTPGSTVQLHLPMTEFQSMQDHAIEALRRLRGAKGLRHWAALLRLFSVQGGRSGTYRWLLSEHLEAMGYDERQRRDPKVRAEAAHEVETLAALELAIYTKGGQLRERRRLLLETGRFERQSGAEYKLDGIEFQMNQRVFGGVRASTGEIGAKWMPAPVELAAVDHVRFPYAHALGMLLTIRIRWRLDEHANHLSLSGEHLLRLAGINFDQERAERTWDKLRRSLDVLVKIEQLERYEWNSDPWSLAGICQIYPSAWLLDRAARGVIPEERPPDRDRPLTGGELKRWRERHGMSQQAAAQRLHVTRQAITKAEQQSNVTLGYKLRAAFETTSRTQDTVPEKSNSPADSEK
jgi:DNA-binding XRE family transcriptional regulator